MFHADELYQGIEASRQHISRWLSWLTPEYDLKAMQEFIEIKEEEFLEATNFAYTIVDKDTDEILGTIEVFSRNKGRLELGYYLLENATGKGAMSEALNTLVDFAFEETPTIRVDLYTLEDNEKSMMVAKRNGFVFEGVHYHQQIDMDDTILDGYRFVKLKDSQAMQKAKDVEEKLIDIYNVKCLKNK
jgi:ribosomal-protein-serine acetyltransferase